MEPMNATQTHAKVRVTASLAAPVFVAGDEVSGKMELDCRTDKGLGISTMMVELVAVQELTSRDHSATSTFMAAKRIYQGPGLPPSNAVFAHPQPGAPALPPNYHQARKGCTTFFFNFPLPQSSPNSINFGNGLAKIFYEIRCTISIFWKGERTTVKHTKEVVVTECLLESRVPREPSTLVAEGGKMVVQAQVVGGIGVTGRPTCVELQVKNHSQKKTTGLTLTLTRTLHLPTVGSSSNPFQIVDTVVTVPFRGGEYTIAPGVEGIANLVFDVPRNARGVKGGTREKTDDGDHKHIEALFYVNTAIAVTVGMGVGSKDLKIELPVQILHPLAVPEPQIDPYQAGPAAYAPELLQMPLEPPRPQYILPPSSSGPPSPASYGTPPLQYQHTATPPHGLPYIPQLSSPVPYAYQPHYVPPPLAYSPFPPADQQYFYPPLPMQLLPVEHLGQVAGAMPIASQSYADLAILATPPPPPVIAHHTGGTAPIVVVAGQTEEGKGERASRISAHLKQSSRNRSASPTSHRYRMSGLPIPPNSNAPPAASAIWGDDAPNKSLKLTPLAPVAPEIKSPRPMPSPKASYSSDPIALSPGQSGRVAALERMAEEEETAKQKSKGVAKKEEIISPAENLPELTAAELNEVLDKALPPPPKLDLTKSKWASAVPKPLFNLFDDARAVGEPKSAIREGEIVQKIWAGEDVEKPTFKEEKKPKEVMVLANLAPRKRHARGREDDGDDSPEKKEQISPIAVRPAELRTAGGLDALENRLLKEVGTRKPSVAMLHQLRALDAVTEGAIKDKVEAKNKLGIEPHLKPTDPSEAATVAPSEDKEGTTHVLLNRKRRRSYDVDRATEEKKEEKASNGLTKQEEEAVKMRKAAKTRVADWLGATMAPEPPPLSETRILEQASADGGPSKKADPVIDEPAATKDVTLESIKIKSESSAKGRVDPSKIQLPGKRSSGFLPMSRQPALPVPPTVTGQTNDAKTPLRAYPAPAALAIPKAANYDVRSARGGRGGKVTSVAAIWAEKAKQNDANTNAVSNAPKNGVPLPLMVKVSQDKVKLSLPSPPTSPFKQGDALKTPPLLSPKEENKTSPKSPGEEKPLPWFKTGLTPARSAPNLIKGTSVPAKLSSSIATPTLSSTASLARPQPVKSPNTTSTDVKPPTIPRPLKAIREELPTSVSAPGLATLSPPPSKPDPPVSFGQAKLRNLIAKYQQGA